MLSAAVIVVGVLSIAESLFHAFRRKRVALHISYFSITIVLMVAFLAGYYSTMSDRYFIFPGSLLLLLGVSRTHQAARTAIHARFPDADEHRRAAKLVAAVVGVTVFAIPNIAVASQVDANWTHPKDASSVLALTRSAIDQQPCYGAARYNTPSLQWATGCHVARMTSLPDALEWARQVEQGVPVFIFWATAAIEADMIEELSDSGWRPLLTYQDGRMPPNQVFFRP